MTDVRTMLFETDRLNVRPFTPIDADDFFAFNSHPEVMRYIRPVKSRPESDAFLLENLKLYEQSPTMGRFHVSQKTDHVFVGTFSLLPMTHAAGIHIGYALMPEYWGRGYALELVQAGTLYFFSHSLDDTLFAITEPENTDSEKVLHKAGYSFQGVDDSEEIPLNIFYKSR